MQRRPDEQRWWTKVLIAVAQVATGLVGGYVVGFGVLFAVLRAARVIGVRTTSGDVAGVAGMVLWTVVVVAGVIHQYRRSWLVLAAAFAVSTTVTALFTIIVVIPFGAGMRDFD